MLVDGNQFTITVVLSVGASCQSNTQKQGLLDDKNKHRGKQETAIATCRIEN